MAKTIYAVRPNLILGFHGCDKSLAERLVLGADGLKSSTNGDDWLGDGVYFWENNVTRALEFAHEKMRRSPDVIKEPSVVGAILHLGNCLDLTDKEQLLEMEKAYEVLVGSYGNINRQIPKNKPSMLQRPLDCAVIKSLDELCQEIGAAKYDSIRASFLEGEPLYPNAGICKKNHIQICVRKPCCILGYFLPMR